MGVLPRQQLRHRSDPEHLRDPGVEAFEDGLTTVFQEVAITFTDDHLAASSHGRHDLGRLQGKQFVTITVEQQQRPTAQTSRYLTARRLRGECDDAADFVHRHSDANGNCPTEGMSHHCDLVRTGFERQLHGGSDIETAGIHVVRSPIRDPEDRNSCRRPPLPESLIQAVRRSEKSSHRPAAEHEGNRVLQ